MSNNLEVRFVRMRTALLCTLIASAAVLLAPAPTMGQALDATPRAENAALSPTLRLRIEWGGGAEHQWHGTLQLVADNAAAAELKFYDLASLGLQADTPGSVQIDGATIRIEQRSPRVYDGFDVSVTAPLDAKLSLRFTDAVGGAPQEVTLTDLVRGYRSFPLDDQKNRILIRRSPGDALRVALERDSLVFDPGETLIVNLQPHLLGLSELDDVQIETTLTEARGGTEQWSTTSTVSLPSDGEASESIELKIPLPDKEGVYDVVIRATQDEASVNLLRNSLGRNNSAVLAQRKVQLVVVNSQKRPQADVDLPPPTVSLVEINPIKRWWEKLSVLSNIPGYQAGPLDSGHSRQHNHATLGEFRELRGTGDRTEPTWEAFPLPIHQPGQVHILEVEYPSDVPQALGISILEPNSAGAVRPLSLDSGVLVPPAADKTAPRMMRHRLVFWPNTKMPYVLFTNRRSKAAAVFGQMRVLGPKHFAVASLRFGGESATRLPRAFPVGFSGSDRRLGMYFEKPLLPDNFGASDAFDATSRRSLDDWVTFYQAGTRAVEYQNYVGYTTLFLSVFADGSSLYPSQHVSPTPRYDTGALFSTAQDPVRKDVLELLLRLYDREGLELVPVLQFNSPLPALERQRTPSGDKPTGIELVGPDGRTWVERYGAATGSAPYYNPLHPAVQRAMLDAVREVATRYGDHRALTGIALGMSADSYAQLPGTEWCLDDDTFARFVRETGTPVFAAGPDRYAQRFAAVTSDFRQVWLAWRAQQMKQFHDQLSDVIREAIPGGKLFLSTTNLVEGPIAEKQFRPVLPMNERVSETLLAHGIDPQLYTASRDIVIVRPNKITTPFSTADNAVPLYLASAQAFNEQFANLGQSGGIFVHPPDRVKLRSFDAVSPFGPDRTLTHLATQWSLSGHFNRQRFVRQLATADTDLLIDGGWRLPMGQEAALRDWIRVYRRLPQGDYQTLPGSDQLVVARTLKRGGSLYVLLLNASAWQVTTSMNTEDVKAIYHAEQLGTGETLQVAAGKPLTAVLEPFSLQAYRFVLNPGIQNVAVTYPANVEADLARQVSELSSRATTLQSPPAREYVSNRDFETLAPNGSIADWELVGQGDIAAVSDETMAHQGRRSVHLSSHNGVAGWLSRPFANPGTGRVAYSVWIKQGKSEAQKPLRVALLAKHRGRDYYRFAVARPLSDNWKQFVFAINDLPLNELEDLRIGFELMGGGDVWIDDVAVYDLSFSENEQTEIAKILSVADFQLQEGNTADCARLLEGYWPQFLKTHVPLRPQLAENIPPPVRRQKLPAEQTPAKPEAAEEEGWRRWIPKILR